MVGFTKLLEQATSEALIDIDWGKNMEIIDNVRQGDITGKECIKQIKKRMFNRNPNVAIYTLTLLEAIVKNCGGPVQAEIATKDFMDQFRRLVRGSTMLVKTKCLEIIQTWSHAFQQNPRYKIVPDTYNILRVEGHEFPPMNTESDAMFVAETAPEWADGNDCFACRSRFTLTNRKHHCRCCGQLFCQKCSSKKSTIPKFGIEKPVRVCDNCYSILQGTAEEGASTSAPPSSFLPSLAPETASSDTLTPEQEVARFIELERQSAFASVAPAAAADGGGNAALSAKEQELKEQEEMELAMALSMSEALSQPVARAPSYSNASAPSAQSSYQTPEPSPQKRGMYDAHFEELESAADPMAVYMKQQQQGEQGYTTPEPNEIIVPLSTAEDQEFIRSMENGVGLFEQKLARAKKRGGGVSTDTALQSIFRSLAVMHPELLSRIDNLEDEKSGYDSLKEKLAQIHSASAKLKEVQAEQQAKLEQQRAEQAMLEKIQLEQKMKLLEQQAREQRMHQRAMDEQLRLQQEEARRQEEHRQLAAQEKAVRMEQERLAQQQAELSARRDHASAARQHMEQQQNTHRLNQMHMQVEQDRQRAQASQALQRQQSPYGFAPMPAVGNPAMPPAPVGPMPVPPARRAPPSGPPPQQQQQQQYAPPPQQQIINEPPQPPGNIMNRPPPQQQQQQYAPPPQQQMINQPPQPPGNTMNRPPPAVSQQEYAPTSQPQFQLPPQGMPPQMQQGQQFGGPPPQTYGMPPLPHQQQYQQQYHHPHHQQQQFQGGPPLAFQQQQAPPKTEEPLISFD